MRVTGAAILILLLFAACNAETKPAAPADPAGSVTPSATAQDPEPGVAAPVLMSIGTVEEAVTTQVTVAGADRAPAMTIDEQRTYKKDLAMVNIDVTRSDLRELWLSFVTTSTERFASRPVVARLTVWREIGLGKEAVQGREKIGGTNFVLGAAANAKRTRDGASIPQPTYQIDAFGGLDTLPETMLIHGEVELSLLPPGTPEADVDPDAETPGLRDTIVKPTNPVRINITPAPATP